MTVQRFSPLLSWWHTGRHDTGEVSTYWEFYIQMSRQQKETEKLGLVWPPETSNCHTTSNKATPPIMSLPMSLWGPFSFKLPHPLSQKKKKKTQNSKKPSKQANKQVNQHSNRYKWRTIHKLLFLILEDTSEKLKQTEIKSNFHVEGKNNIKWMSHCMEKTQNGRGKEN